MMGMERRGPGFDDEPTKKVRRVSKDGLQVGRRYRVVRAFGDVDVGMTLRFRERQYFSVDSTWYLQFVTGEGEPVSLCEKSHGDIIADLDLYLAEET
jgi:hypothetical protein